MPEPTSGHPGGQSGAISPAAAQDNALKLFGTIESRLGYIRGQRDNLTRPVVEAFAALEADLMSLQTLWGIATSTTRAAATAAEDATAGLAQHGQQRT